MSGSLWINQMQQLFATTDPELAATYQNLGKLEEQKLWHQLTVAIEEFVSLSKWNVKEGKATENGKTLLSFYNEFISTFAAKLNPLKLAQIAVKISIQFGDDKEGKQKFLEGVVDKVKADKEASLFANSSLATVLLSRNSIDQCKVMLEELKEEMESLSGTEPTVYGAYYYANSCYYKRIKDYVAYYKATLSYLAYVPLEFISVMQQRDISFSLAIAALVGEDVYNFGELLGNPVVESLKDQEQYWIIELVNSFNNGEISAFENCQDKIKQIGPLAEHKQLMYQKLQVLCLMELVFARPSSDRRIGFNEIAERTKLNENTVEILVMKALSLGLVRGTIDQVKEEVSFTWVQPRVLDLNQVAKLKEKLISWEAKVNETTTLVTTTAPELVEQSLHSA